MCYFLKRLSSCKKSMPLPKTNQPCPRDKPQKKIETPFLLCSASAHPSRSLLPDSLGKGLKCLIPSQHVGAFRTKPHKTLAERQKDSELSQLKHAPPNTNHKRQPSNHLKHRLHSNSSRQNTDKNLQTALDIT